MRPSRFSEDSIDPKERTKKMLKEQLTEEDSCYCCFWKRRNHFGTGWFCFHSERQPSDICSKYRRDH